MDHALAMSLQEQFNREARQRQAEADYNQALKSSALRIAKTSSKTNDDDDDDNATSTQKGAIAGVLDRQRYKRFLSMKAGAADVDVDAVIDSDEEAPDGTRFSALHNARQRGQRTTDATVARRMLT